MHLDKLSQLRYWEVSSDIGFLPCSSLFWTVLELTYLLLCLETQQCVGVGLGVLQLHLSG